MLSRKRRRSPLFRGPFGACTLHAPKAPGSYGSHCQRTRTWETIRTCQGTGAIVHVPRIALSCSRKALYVLSRTLELALARSLRSCGGSPWARETRRSSSSRAPRIAPASVPEVPHAREEHRHAARIARRDHVLA